MIKTYIKHYFIDKFIESIFNGFIGKFATTEQKLSDLLPNTKFTYIKTHYATYNECTLMFTDDIIMYITCIEPSILSYTFNISIKKLMLHDIIDYEIVC